ncbi:unnamed protein product [Zymoseptoria tritici ST99CH_1A5]|uniref:Myb-like domain-containing protein n=2 Tax=Zymoseptoria tritici TaxID=1047171 RepID=A0A2H1G3P9_ZYMTR|nr:unnamed protein product [Zymoseptoria tritici ST99CH_1E4]SMR49399.1 unnamed protein product [Zymoseptoria tritici ST99CH_3D1]SMY22096.1 unnamed protein product [Zymoseptoria tritici ST99CH_1A5]
MAKLSSAAVGDAPRATAPTRSTRQTRSQSAEPSTVPETKEKKAAGKTNEDGVAANKRGKKSKKTNELPTVEEDAAVEDDAAVESAVDEGGVERESPLLDDDETRAEELEQRTRRASGLSGISGTTAKTSFSQEEAEQLDADVILDVLPTLVAASDNLAQWLVPSGLATRPETWKEIRTPGTRHNKVFNVRMGTIIVHKPSLGSLEYIQPKIVLRVLLGAQSLAEVEDAPWRPDSIIFKINLTQMLSNLLVTCNPGDLENTALEVLERIDVAFPDAIAGSHYSRHTFEFWLNFAAQLTIARLRASIESDPNFFPDGLINSVFHDQDDVFRHAQSFGLPALSGKDDDELSNAYVMVEDLRESLLRAFEHNEPAAAITALQEQFRWETFENHALRYYVARSTALDEDITLVGGVDGILEDLAQEVEHVANQKRIDEAKQKLSISGTPKKSFASKGAMARMKERMSLATQQNQAPVAQMTADQPEDNFVAQDEDEEDTGVPSQQAAEPITEPRTQVAAGPDEEPQQKKPPPTQRSRATAALMGQAETLTQRAGTQRPKARFTDPQVGARRITNIDEDEQDGTQSSHRAQPRPAASQDSRPSSTALGKRRREEVEDDEEEDAEFPDPTQDEGFQVDTRDPSVADQRRRELAFGNPIRQPQRQRETGESSAGVYRDTQSPAKRQRKNPGSAIPPPERIPDTEDGALTASQMYQQAKHKAKINRITATRNKEPKARVPWSEDEEGALGDLIEQYGVSWSELKTRDAARGEEQQLWRRSAEDLRFKARNMKLTMLEAHRNTEALPPNWEHVVLDKKMIDKLHKLNIDYRQERQRAPRMMDE